MLPPDHTRVVARDNGERVSRRSIVVLPNGFTLFNLLCGMFAIVSASRGDFNIAAFAIVSGGVADALDGRVARATGTGSRFGSELDSLVDAISFGLAPALIMYFAVFNKGRWDWLFCFFFTACAVIRLARFNIEQAGREKRYHHGLPSPAAGLTLATYYWFSQTPLYNETMLGDLNWTVALTILMMLLAFLMISNVSYPAVPTIGFRKLSEILGTIVVVAAVLGVFFLRKEFYFPALVLYVLYGIAKTVIFGLLGRGPKDDAPVISDDEPLLDEADFDETPHRSSRRRRKRKHRPSTPLGNPLPPGEM
ncbi:MAG: CDP-diacylglycerol--serine O-phosphatidyltransferase [Gemmatimonadaceae bacterium]|nr:CDP-diacylglycerol--serine O-phosphatidyltransferase [Gemmatimonadaceae bacterium]